MHFLYGPAGFGAGKSTCQLHFTYNLQNTFAGTLQQGNCTNYINIFYCLTLSFCHCLAKGNIPIPSKKYNFLLAKFYPLHPFGNSSFASFFHLIYLDLKLSSPTNFLGWIWIPVIHETVHFLQILWLE